MILLDIPKLDKDTFIGKDRGEDIRKLLNLDERDIDDEVYHINIDENISDISISFIIGLLDRSVNVINDIEKFSDKYVFGTDNEYMFNKINTFIALLYSEKSAYEETGSMKCNCKKCRGKEGKDKNPTTSNNRIKTYMKAAEVLVFIFTILGPMLILTQAWLYIIPIAFSITVTIFMIPIIIVGIVLLSIIIIENRKRGI